MVEIIYILYKWELLELEFFLLVIDFLEENLKSNMPT